MKRATWAVVSSMALGIAGCASGSTEGQTQTFRGERFVVEIPSGSAAQTRTPADFTLYSFIKAGRVYLEAYAGNHPTFPMIDPAAQGQEKPEVIAGLKAKCIRSDRGRECLIPTGLAFPEILHFWYETQSPEQAELAEAVMASVRIEAP